MNQEGFRYVTACKWHLQCWFWYQSTTEKREISFLLVAYPIYSLWAPLARKALKFSGNLANDFLMMLSTTTLVFIFGSTAFQGCQKQTLCVRRQEIRSFQYNYWLRWVNLCEWWKLGINASILFYICSHLRHSTGQYPLYWLPLCLEGSYCLYTFSKEVARHSTPVLAYSRRTIYIYRIRL